MRNSFLERGVFDPGPDGLTIRRDVVGGFPEYFYEAVESFATGVLCDVVGAQESFFRSIGATSLAHRAAISRVRGGCYVGAPPSLIPTQAPPPFEGGQCPGTSYLVDWRFSPFRSGPLNGNAQVWGPIEGLQLRPDPSRPTRGQVALVGREADGITELLRSLFFYPLGQEPTGLAVTNVRSLSGPDNCGSLPPGAVSYPPGLELPPAPTPGEPIAPPGLTEPVFTGPGLAVPVVLAHGALNFNFDGSVNVDIGGFNLSIYPDLTFEIGDRGVDDVEAPGHEFEDFVSDAVETIGDGVQVNGNDIREVADVVTVQVEGTAEAVDCFGGSVSEGYFGLGLLGIQAQITSTLSVLNSILAGLCPVGPSDPVYEILPLGSFQVGPIRRFFDVDIPEGAEVLFIDGSTTFPPYAVAAPGNDDQDSIQSRFAQVSFLWNFEGELFSLPAEHQFYSNGAYLIPGNLPPGSKVRISGYPESGFTLSTVRRI